MPGVVRRCIEGYLEGTLGVLRGFVPGVAAIDELPASAVRSVRGGLCDR